MSLVHSSAAGASWLPPRIRVAQMTRMFDYRVQENSTNNSTMPSEFSRCGVTLHRRSDLLLIVLMTGLITVSGCSPKAATQSDTEATVSLFNGRNLDGWTIYGTERWFVENGELVCESGPDAQYGYLATNEFYKDFELSVDFLQEADGNSGLFFRSTIDGTKITGWQAEVAPPGQHSGGIYESYGRGWLIQPDSTLDGALKMGKWNTMRLRVIGDRVTTWINGTEMIDLTDEKIGTGDGSIALQIHDGGGIRVRWRNLRLKQL